MRSAVSSAVGQSGRVTVRVPTPEDALAWAADLRDGGSKEVTITVTATGVQVSEEQLKARLRKRDLQRGTPKRIEPKFQAH